MFMKPKNTSHNNRGTLYKRFKSLYGVDAASHIYITSDGKAWMFHMEQLNFIETENEPTKNRTQVLEFDILAFQENYYSYEEGMWKRPTQVDIEKKLLPIKYNNIGKIQANKYYENGSFRFVIKGSEGITSMQAMKGLITPLRNLTIKYWCDKIDIRPDDLVVVDGRLYSVESIDRKHKYMPSSFYTYFAVLNSIL